MFKSFVAKIHEDNQTLPIEIHRSKGLYGRVRLYYNVTGAVTGRSAHQNIDYESGDGFVDFAEGQKVGIINMTIIDDDTPELDESFLVTMTKTELLETIPGNTLVWVFLLTLPMPDIFFIKGIMKPAIFTEILKIYIPLH